MSKFSLSICSHARWGSFVFVATRSVIRRGRIGPCPSAKHSKYTGHLILCPATLDREWLIYFTIQSAISSMFAIFPVQEFPITKLRLHRLGKWAPQVPGYFSHLQIRCILFCCLSNHSGFGIPARSAHLPVQPAMEYHGRRVASAVPESKRQ